ncbi:failed axon connections-like [Amphibalanus amphitrite]|uniref:failed axon connections-like n=1 Tax=Amphibalanus amphitrite TaxID=1232801 RepID=UPI001C915F91|nr:failed axon connections-like [Amphibalanus amphitrite]
MTNEAAETKTETPAAPTAGQDVPVKEEVKAEVNKEEKSDQDTEKEKKTEEKKEKKPAAPPKPTVHKADFEKDVVYLFQFSRTPVLPSISPFCLKVETFLRVAGIKYENVDHRMKLRSKKGQLPFVELNGEEISDSSFIIKELSAKFEKDLDAALSTEQKTLSHAMITMVENHLHWIVSWWKTKVPVRMLDGYKMDLQKVFQTKIPAPILNFVFKQKMKSKSKAVKAVGLGVHKSEEIEDLGKSDLKALSDQLQDKPFFFGDEPTLLDIVTFANVAQLVFLDKEVECPLRSYIEESHTNLVGHANRIKERFYPDWEEMCQSLELNTHLPKPPPKEEVKEEVKKEEAKKEAPEAAAEPAADKEKADEDKEKEEDNKKAETEAKAE